MSIHSNRTARIIHLANLQNRTGVKQQTAVEIKDPELIETCCQLLDGADQQCLDIIIPVSNVTDEPVLERIPETNDSDIEFSEPDIDPDYVLSTELSVENNSDSEESLYADVREENITSSPHEKNLDKSADDNITESIGKPSKSDLKQASTNRVHGLEYIGYEVKERSFVAKPARKIMSKCKHTVTNPKSHRSFLCATFSEKDRKLAFNTFWKIPTWAEKQAYVRALVCTRSVTRRRSSTAKNLPKRKNHGHDIYLKKQDGSKLKVCRKFFLATLNLGEDSFKRWIRDTNETVGAVENSSSSSDEEIIQKKRKCVKTDKILKRGRKKGSSQSSQSLAEWIDLLPKVPSHYCRASSKRVYVESTFNSERHMYKIYSEWCENEQKKRAGRRNFTAILREKKISIHSPRKDQCDTCLGHDFGSIDDQTYNDHIKLKNEARQRKQTLKESASEKRLVVTMDLQSVLLSPKTLASAMYYKTKLQVHNFSIYELNKRHVELYVWDESEGGVSSNEFVSCIINYISKNCNFKEIVLISDGCTYQNRNRVLSFALSTAAKEYGIEIMQVILEKGHTMMEVDSVHSTLEGLFKPPIYSPADYHSRMRLARPGQPYVLNVIHHEFFKDYEKISTLSSIRPGRKVGDAVVTDIRQLRYTVSGEIFYTLNYSDDWIEIPCRIKNSVTLLNAPRLYTNRIPISKSKYDNLQELKKVIDKDHHQFYDNLPFSK